VSLIFGRLKQEVSDENGFSRCSTGNKAGLISEEKALEELSKHQPNNQICILKQGVVDKYLKFLKSVITE